MKLSPFTIAIIKTAPTTSLAVKAIPGIGRVTVKRIREMDLPELRDLYPQARAARAECAGRLCRAGSSPYKILFQLASTAWTCNLSRVEGVPPQRMVYEECYRLPNTYKFRPDTCVGYGVLRWSLGNVPIGEITYDREKGKLCGYGRGWTSRVRLGSTILRSMDGEL